MTKQEKIDLLSELCLTFGPTGREEPVAEKIKQRLIGRELRTDRLGNIIVHLPCPSRPDAKRLMISAHMDEVGFIISEITDDGYLKFKPLGGIDARVLCGKHVTVEGKNGFLPGVIASKAIHHQTAEDKKAVTPIKNMYIDIGARDRDNARELTDLGYCGTFDSDFVVFGENGGFIKGRAIDDRLGCAVMLDVLSRLGDAPLDIYFCFTVREEIGLSGARTVAASIDPDFAVILESTAVADLPDVPDASRVAVLGGGGALSLRDRSTIYDREFVRFAFDTARRAGIPVQYKKYLSGGNDAGSIHKSVDGVRCLAISAPSRYIHSPACVVSTDDYLSMSELLLAIIENFDALENNNA